MSMGETKVEWKTGDPPAQGRYLVVCQECVQIAGWSTGDGGLRWYLEDWAAGEGLLSEDDMKVTHWTELPEAPTKP
jgi:hypothetical protein